MLQHHRISEGKKGRVSRERGEWGVCDFCLFEPSALFLACRRKQQCCIKTKKNKTKHKDGKPPKPLETKTEKREKRKKEKGKGRVKTDTHST